MLSVRTPALAAISLLALSFAPASFAGDGTPDPGFGEGGIVYMTPDDIEARELKPYAAIALPDGKTLVAGERNKFVQASPFDPHMQGMLARFDAPPG